LIADLRSISTSELGYAKVNPNSFSNPKRPAAYTLASFPRPVFSLLFFRGFFVAGLQREFLTARMEGRCGARPHFWGTGVICETQEIPGAVLPAKAGIHSAQYCKGHFR
jgi:hypothetical protein